MQLVLQPKQPTSVTSRIQIKYIKAVKNVNIVTYSMASQIVCFHKVLTESLGFCKVISVAG